MATILTRCTSRRVTGAVGAVVEGIDLTRPLAEEELRFVRRTLVEHGVVFFHGQDLRGERMVDFVAQFATPKPSKFGEQENKPTGVDADFGLNKRHTAIWHADGTFAADPALFTALRAVELPELGGDTCWSSMYAAYDALSAPLRAMLDGLTAIHSVAPIAERMGDMGRRYADRASTTYGGEHAHPVVLVHPETGRKALYVNASWTTRIVEFTKAESDGLLRLLFEHIKQPDFCLRWTWRPNDVAIWDNRCVQHYAVPDYEGRRVMQRVDTVGERPRGTAQVPIAA